MLGQAQGGWRLDRAATARAISQAGQRYGLPVDPQASVESLALGERQRVEILKAILRGARLLILDEPTSILSPPEIEALLAFLDRFRADGNAVVFITHKLREVLQVADEIVVLRDGALAGRTAAAAATAESLARMMVGRDTPAPIERTQAARGPVRLRATGLAACDVNGTRRLEDASLTLHAGEVLALAGIDGNGQAELCDVLAGLMPPLGGRIELDGVDVTTTGSQARVAGGIAYIPADRAGTSLVQAMSIDDNLMLRDIRRAPFSRRGLLDRAAQQRVALERFREFDVRAASTGAPARTLSGGNQQKVVLARELGRDPRVVIAFQPTWGLDPGSTRFVIERVLQLRNAGAAVLYLSSELDEVLAVGDRIGVISGGRIVEVVDRAEVDLKRLGLALAGSGALRSAA
jgi:simple sugar transport system ATP-binding protein